MATNQTTNYQLNQWEPTDQVLRTDFNADNAKTDAALKTLADEALSLPGADAVEEEAKNWFHLGIRYELLHQESLDLLQTRRCLSVLNRYGCRDRTRTADYDALSRECRRKTELWARDLLDFWRRNELSDAAEYLDTRLAGIYGCVARKNPERSGFSSAE